MGRKLGDSSCKLGLETQGREGLGVFQEQLSFSLLLNARGILQSKSDPIPVEKSMKYLLPGHEISTVLSGPSDHVSFMFYSADNYGKIHCNLF